MAFTFERTGDRTLDPQIKSLLLYQLSYPPDAKSCISFFELLFNTSTEKCLSRSEWSHQGPQLKLKCVYDILILPAGMVELADT